MDNADSRILQLVGPSNGCSPAAKRPVNLGALNSTLKIRLSCTNHNIQSDVPCKYDCHQFTCTIAHSQDFPTGIITLSMDPCVKL